MIHQPSNAMPHWDLSLYRPFQTQCWASIDAVKSHGGGAAQAIGNNGVQSAVVPFSRCVEKAELCQMPSTLLPRTDVTPPHCNFISYKCVFHSVRK